MGMCWSSMAVAHCAQRWSGTDAGLGVSNNWAGLVIWGAVRDTAALQQLDLGIKALGSNPWTSGKNGVGVVDVTLQIGNATFAPGRWVYADEDGIIVADGELA